MGFRGGRSPVSSLRSSSISFMGFPRFGGDGNTGQFKMSKQAPPRPPRGGEKGSGRGRRLRSVDGPGFVAVAFGFYAGELPRGGPLRGEWLPGDPAALGEPLG